jgi:short-subunit dehydrogenase involved in D-alanine esterification of teichoic acids
MIDVNLVAPALLTRSALPVLQAREATMTVNVAFGIVRFEGAAAARRASRDLSGSSAG